MAAAGLELPVKAGGHQGASSDVIIDAAALTASHAVDLHGTQHQQQQQPPPQQAHYGRAAPQPHQEPSQQVALHVPASTDSEDTRTSSEHAPEAGSDDETTGRHNQQENRPSSSGGSYGPDHEEDRDDREDVQLLPGDKQRSSFSILRADQQIVGEKKWYRDRSVLVAVVGSALVAFSWNFLDELTPIFVSAPPDKVQIGQEWQ